MTTLLDNLSNKQKKILELINNKKIDKLLNNYDWGLVYNSIRTFQVLGLVDFTNIINYPEQLKTTLKGE